MYSLVVHYSTNDEAAYRTIEGVYNLWGTWIHNEGVEKPVLVRQFPTLFQFM